MPASNTLSLGFGLLSLAVWASPAASASERFPRQADTVAGLSSVKFEGGRAKVFVPFTWRDVVSGAPSTSAVVYLNDGRVVNAYDYLRELNALGRELAGYGVSLRSDESDLGVVARAQIPQPQFRSELPDSQQQQSNDSGWSHELTHAFAHVRATGRITQKTNDTNEYVSFERTTTHSVEGRFMSADQPSIAQFMQRVVRNELGEEQRETQIYINGRQVFRRGRADPQEARIWKTAFDVPLKSITVPVGPGSIDAKLGIRGGVNLDLNMSPVTGSNNGPQIALDFKPQVLADGYVSGATSPTNVGDAGFEGAITLTDNTLKIVGTAALSRAKLVDLKEVTVDNTFAGFNGRLVGFVNVKTPKRNSDGKDTKRFEKEFYKWDGIKVEKRLYEYKAPQPQPPAL